MIEPSPCRFAFPVLALALLATTAPAQDLAQIKARGVLRAVVWSENLPELYAVKAGGDSGLEREILEGFARLHELRLEVVSVPSLDSRIPALLDGKGDLVAGGLVATESRRKLVNFTTELFPIRHVAVTYGGSPIAAVDELRLARVGTIKGSSWSEEVAAAGVPPAHVDDSFTSASQLVAGLRSGKVSAIVMSAVWAAVEARKDPRLQLGVLLGAPTSVGYAVRKDQPRLLAALDEYIGNVRLTPTWSRLVVKYFGENGLDILRRSREK